MGRNTEVFGIIQIYGGGGIQNYFAMNSGAFWDNSVICREGRGISGGRGACPRERQQLTPHLLPSSQTQIPSWVSPQQRRRWRLARLLSHNFWQREKVCGGMRRRRSRARPESPAAARSWLAAARVWIPGDAGHGHSSWTVQDATYASSNRALGAAHTPTDTNGFMTSSPPSCFN